MTERKLEDGLKRDFTLAPEGPGHVICFPSSVDACLVFPVSEPEAFLVPRNSTPANDEDLAEATRRINRILSEVAEKRFAAGTGERLSILRTRRGPMFGWVRCVDDDPETFERVMGI
ncbi:hypothetical protein [Bailinhaonella thermotolerans]|nr:hypothetical protein [Bailinhaonella thermotolerans]